MKRAPVTKASLALVLLLVGGHSVQAADQGVVTLLCTWNKQCTSAGACSSYTGSAHYKVDYAKQTVGIELGNGGYDTVPAKITDKEISFSQFSQWTINRQTGEYSDSSPGIGEIRGNCDMGRKKE
jgi:hypothetical protein